jgi:anti-anti-sigma regulatory factor
VRHARDVRGHGCIDSASSLGIDGHACWAFDRDREFTDAALEFLEDGLRMGQRIGFVASGSAAEHRERLDPLGNVGGLLDSGRLQLFSLSDLYAVGEPIDSEAQLAIFGAATDRALADGYSGLRVAGQVTDLVVDPSGWDAHLRWEGIADRYMARRPLAALCGYQRTAVPKELLGDLAAVHPASHGTATLAPFRLFANSDALVLEGEVDQFSAEALDRLLELAFDGQESATLDLGELEFIDQHGLRTLVAHADRLDSKEGLSVERMPYLVERLCDLLGLKL